MSLDQLELSRTGGSPKEQVAKMGMVSSSISRPAHFVSVRELRLRPASHPGVIDASDALLRPVQHKEGCQVGSIGSNDDHSKTCPHHT